MQKNKHMVFSSSSTLAHPRAGTELAAGRGVEAQARPQLALVVGRGQGGRPRSGTSGLGAYGHGSPPMPS
jgi:hypothetical protein